ncbi:hypothetical protein Tco_1133734 [Tanacetum coccineum]
MWNILEDVAKKEEQNMLTKADQALKDDLTRMIAQEMAAKAIDDATRQAFEEEKKRAAQATSINKLNTGRPSVSTSNSPLVSTANTPYASVASTLTGANTDGSLLVYLGGRIPIDASTLPNVDLPIDPNMPDLEDDSDVIPNDGIFSGAFDDEDIILDIISNIFGNMKRGYVGEHVPLLPAMLAGAAEDQGKGSTIPAEPHHTPIDPIPSTSQPSIPSTTEPPHSSPPRSIDRQDTEVPQPQGPTITLVADEATTTSVGVKTEGFATTTSGLDAGMDSSNIHGSPLRSHEAPLPEGNTSGSVEDSLQLKELMAIVPKMVTKIDSLEKELKETKQTLGNVVLTLAKKVKSLEVALKRMSKMVILSDSEDEETKNQGRKIQDIDDDPLVSLVKESMKEKEADFVTHKKASASGEAQEEDISPTILEAAQILSQRLNSAEVEVNTEVNPGSAIVNTGNTPVSTPSVVQTVILTIPSPVKDQREGKAPMTAKDVQATQKTKAQIEQEKSFTR